MEVQEQEQQQNEYESMILQNSSQSLNFSNSSKYEPIEDDNLNDKTKILVPLSFHKQILKSQKNPRKGFIKKQFGMQPILLLRELELVNKFVLFGFQDIETYYKDYTNPYDNSLINSSNSLLGISSISNNNNKNELQLNLYSKGSSGIKDFEFLIKHFSKFNNLTYQQLYQQLIKYQEISNYQKIHYQNLKMKIHSRIVTEEEINKTKEDFNQFVEQTIQPLIDNQSFYSYDVFQIDFELMDVAPIKKCISKATLSLYGLETKDCEQLILHQGERFCCSFGKERLNETLEFLTKITSNQAYSSNSTFIKTLDKINFPVLIEEKIVYWEGRPSWASKLDFVIILQYFDLPIQTIRNVIEQREKQNISDIEAVIYEKLQFEYIVQNEIFLEKFYPDLFKDIQNKKSLQKLSNNNQNQNSIIIEE